jgi:glutamyl-tRNA synthetase
MGMSPEKLIKNIKSFSVSQKKAAITVKHELTFKNNIEILREKSKTFSDIIDNAQFFIMERPIVIDEIDGELLTELSLKMLQRLTLKLSNAKWNRINLEEILSTFALVEKTKFQMVAQPLRVALIGTKSSPNIAEIMNILGREETLNRLSDVL